MILSKVTEITRVPSCKNFVPSCKNFCLFWAFKRYLNLLLIFLSSPRLIHLKIHSFPREECLKYHSFVSNTNLFLPLEVFRRANPLNLRKTSGKRFCFTQSENWSLVPFYSYNASFLSQLVLAWMRLILFCTSLWLDSFISIVPPLVVFLESLLICNLKGFLPFYFCWRKKIFGNCWLWFERGHISFSRFILKLQNRHVSLGYLKLLFSKTVLRIYTKS